MRCPSRLRPLFSLSASHKVLIFVISTHKTPTPIAAFNLSDLRSKMETTNTNFGEKTQYSADDDPSTPSTSVSETAPLTATAMTVSSTLDKDEQQSDTALMKQLSACANTVKTSRVHYSSYAEQFGAFLRAVWTSSSPKSPEMINLLQALDTDWPNVPPHEILVGEPWCGSQPIIRTNTRFTNELASAISNIIRAGRTVSTPEEESILRHLLSHPSGWSACDPQHFNDPCFQYIQWRFRHLGPLYPILDDIWWEEVVDKLPFNIEASLVSRILLASESGFHVYTPEIDCMYKAGETLEQVFDGLRMNKDLLSEEGWEFEEVEEIELDHLMYFLDWYADSERRGYNVKAGDIQPFIPPDGM